MASLTPIPPELHDKFDHMDCRPGGGVNPIKVPAYLQCLIEKRPGKGQAGGTADRSGEGRQDR
jgi:hypothetical protein